MSRNSENPTMKPVPLFSPAKKKSQPPPPHPMVPATTKMWNEVILFFRKKLKKLLEKSRETNGEPFISADCFLLSLHSADCCFLEFRAE